MTVGKRSKANTKRWMWIGLSAVALAAVIFLGGALSTPDSDEPVALAPTPVADVAGVSGGAEASSPPTVTVPGSADQTRPVATAGSGEKTVAADAKRARGDAGFTDPVDELAALLPTAIAGWDAGQLVDKAPDAMVTFLPQRGSEADARIERAVFSVHDMKTPKKAQKFVSGVSKTVYAENASTLKAYTIDDAYFGTGATGTAVVAFSRGRFAFDLLLVAEQSVDPALLKPTAQKLLAEFPATK